MFDRKLCHFKPVTSVLHCNCVASEELEQQEDITVSYQMLQQQLKQADETIATLLSGRRNEPSQLFTALLLTMLYLQLMYSCVLLK